uniref:Transmembrane protein 208 n=1 Tax=Ditylenchus dipsaci TaxID=166011 RepID=A0A915E5G7_9BILA
MQKTGKQAARGQKQIHAENSSTILHYSVTSLCSSIFVAALCVWVFKSTTGFWVGWSLASLLQAVSVGIMYSMVKGVKNERNQVVDAGLDLNDPQAFGEYCRIWLYYAP